MYAVIETGGKQYRVELGTELAVERLAVNPGDSVELDRVLLVADGDSAHVGTPIVAQATVTAHVLRQDRGEKLVVFKYRPKARHRSKKGHRQELTVLRVEDIRFDGRSAAQEAGTQAREQAKARRAAHAEAERKAAADQELAAKLAADAQAARAEAEPTATTRKRVTKTATPKAAPEGAGDQATEGKLAAKPGARSKPAAGGRAAKAAGAATAAKKQTAAEKVAPVDKEGPAAQAKATRSTRSGKSTKKDS